ncbi:ABC-three component system protein [Cellvibrio fontiphilus]|uniref:ABC-three component system protein n=1 Tax=Cellvibrio fontiphilus TaxID=1815559 RepID=A0ABV7FG04_9GAMM
MEVLDDVAEITGNGNVIVEQTKSGMAHNPVSDWAIDLWKTFSNWVDAVNSQSLDLEKTFFKLYVAQPYTGDFIAQISNAKTKEDVESILTYIWARFEKEKPKGCSEYLKNFFSAPIEVKIKIIINFTYECGNNELYSDLKSLMSPFVSASMIDNACQKAVGLVKVKTDELIAAGKPAVIPASEFLNDFRAYIRKHDRDNILSSFSLRPTELEISDALDEFPTFIKQLDLIECDSDEKIRAMSDFLRSSSEKTIWSERGLIYKDSFDELEENLISNWRNEKNRVEITQQELSDVNKGKLIYIGNVQKNYRLEEKDLPLFFSNGTLHSLADRLKLGWHPHFKRELQPNDE